MKTTIFFVFSCSLSWCTLFFLSMIFHGENCKTKLSFFGYFQKSQKRQFCFAIFSMKNASTEKNKVYHDKEHEKTKKMIVFIFFHRPPESGLILHRSCVMVPRPASGDGTSALWEGTPTLCRGCREAK